MTDPTRKRQLEELDQVTLCARILCQARSELYVNMKFLDVSLSSLGFEADWAREGLGTDGHLIYYGPDYLLGLYKRGRTLVNRGYLHMLFHCLFCHMYTRKDRDKGYWDLSCDIAMEYVIDGLYQKCVYVPRSALRREIYIRLEKALAEKGPAGKTAVGKAAKGSAAEGKAGRSDSAVTPVLTAERIYRALLEMELPERRLDMLKAEFFVDSHDLWEQEDSPKIARSRQNQWNDNREKMQTELETGSKDASEDNRSLLEEVRVENRERYDYSRFLQKFAVLKEEMQVDPDSFDYAFYTYGLSLYGNMPLIEPLESREVYRVEDFAIVIDTSMSCSGELVRRFLEETYDVLSETESYFKKVHLHIIQCDDAVQSDVLVTSQEELKAYMNDFEIRGRGGTDFRPAFEYVNGLKKSRQAASLKGLIYFTDGKGIYPVQAPSYDTAFVFIENMFSDESVPPWAMKVVLEEEQLMEYRTGNRNGEMEADRDSRNGHGQ
ncbi:VWA-like domain-containing protein [Enterocloster clostridioformis]|uniref:vWA domain-containing protein n=1 Tax=Enterocloster clostridioformis TaxID=1531 RepID=UPI0003F8DD52|nr:VWA-like domain-containing protein [Enterocloster clostridioformis]